jgi:hypothetical protein
MSAVEIRPQRRERSRHDARRWQQHAWFIIVAPSDLLNIDWMIGSTSVADHARAKLEMSSITSSSPRAQLRRAEHLGHHSVDQIHDSSQHHL